MQVNMLAAKSQLSRLVKAAQAGEEVIIACHGKAQVKLVPCTSSAGLKQLGALVGRAGPLSSSEQPSCPLTSAQVDVAFSAEVDAEVALLLVA